jgi:predicted metal-dependent phosphotriesterase family hydrolase
LNYIEGGKTMNLDTLIKEKYGSVDKLIEETNTLISRSYLYQIVGGDKTNLSVDVAKELTKILELNSIEELLEIINVNKEV